MRFAHASCLLLAGLASAELDVVGVMERVKPESRQCSGDKADGGDWCMRCAPFNDDTKNIFPGVVYPAASTVVVNKTRADKSRIVLGNTGPGVLGQGTANMQSPSYNLLYAKDVVANLPGDLAQASDGDALGKPQKEAMMALVTQDKFNFASAAWFHKTQCPDQKIKAKLRDSGLEGCRDYIQKCVGVKKVDADRAQLNTMVFKEMGVDSAQKCVPLWEC
ncbi:hypothetical protein OCS_04112 [Ophiocordyceps sinensis CO18]|uniref:Uncharacterized protein n=1 Tax=Ophiocordyceps sinensis (strain Co18 / CGMCC 3.14243) TaxID=911162 RepID=T5AC81_OPHSC|nr:hypothetical protein OCS_04112 [Ophiocordyceps sinensis CO18]